MSFKQDLSGMLTSVDSRDWLMADEIINLYITEDPQYLLEVCEELSQEPIFDVTKYPQSLDPNYATAINHLRDFCFLFRIEQAMKQ